MDYCNDIECEYYKQGVCVSVDRYHSTDRFCITGRRKPKDEMRELMRESEPIGFKRGGKYVSN